MSLWKDMFIDNMFFSGDGSYHFYKVQQLQSKALVWSVLIFISILFFVFMLLGWIVQKILVKIFGEPSNGFAKFILNGKLVRLALGWGLLGVFELILQQTMGITTGQLMTGNY